MTDPHTAASWHYQNAKRHAHKTGIGMTIRGRAGRGLVSLFAAIFAVVAIVAFIVGMT